ncbi:MAG: V-type ATP synthase subunit D, partial [Clostridia bacterium]
MAKLNVNPTRMELKRLKARLKTAVRGHKLLKDKSDEMIRQFSVLIRKNKELRETVEKGLSETLSAFTLARSLISEKTLEVALAMPSKSVELTCGAKNIMSVSVPDIQISESESGEIFPY